MTATAAPPAVRCGETHTPVWVGPRRTQITRRLGPVSVVTNVFGILMYDVHDIAEAAVHEARQGRVSVLVLESPHSLRRMERDPEVRAHNWNMYPSK